MTCMWPFNAEFNTDFSAAFHIQFGATFGAEVGAKFVQVGSKLAPSWRQRIDLGSLWNHLESQRATCSHFVAYDRHFATCGDHSGVALGHFGVTVAPLWGDFGVDLGGLWLTLGQILNDFG